MVSSVLRNLVVPAFLAASLGLAAVAQADGTLAESRAKHSIELRGRSVPYTVEWAELALPIGSSTPDATISATSYLRDGAADATRPVIFAFNGGPGASSTPLHFGLLGPRVRVETPGSPSPQFVDNPDSLLDAADLVFIDPVGTGFNRELRPGGLSPYLTVQADAKAVEALIRHWLKGHGRSASPIVVVGESYGGMRAAMLAPLLADLDLRGLVLVSPMIDGSASMTGNSDQAVISELPTMAVTAAYHGRTTAAGRSPDQIFEQARALAQGPLASALQLGRSLPAEVRDRLAGEIAPMIGLPAATVARYNLRVPSQDFLEQLLPEKVVGRIDTRKVGPAQPTPLIAGRNKAADDPALKMGASNVKKSPSARQYFTDEVGVPPGRDYVALTLDVNFAWDWRAPSPKFEDNASALNSAPVLARVMQSRPGLKLFVATSHYDLATPALAARYSLAHADVPIERTTLRTYAAGHAPYEGEGERAVVASDLRSFLDACLASGQSPGLPPGQSRGH